MKTTQQGFGLIEVMVSLAVLLIGIAALMQLQTRIQQSTTASYQSTQAMMLAHDMASRLENNRLNAAAYLVDGLGTSPCPDASSSMVSKDLAEWCANLIGESESLDNPNAGSIIGVQGCVEEIIAGTEYRVTVAWKGAHPTSVPIGSSCGAGDYNGGSCTDDTCRRIYSTSVRIGTLKVEES